MPKRNTLVATGRRKGFWNLLTFSMKGTVIRPAGTAAMDSTPSSLLGITRSRLKVGKKYHSGKISSGVAKGFAGSPVGVGCMTARPTIAAKVPAKKTTFFSHALFTVHTKNANREHVQEVIGPRWLTIIVVAHSLGQLRQEGSLSCSTYGSTLARSFGSDKSGFFITLFITTELERRSNALSAGSATT